jgi:hypothetical protein
MKNEGSGFFSTLLTLLCVGAGAGFLRNALAMEPELDETAHAMVCAEAGAACKARLSAFERGAVGRNWWFDLGGSTVLVHCERQYVVVGDYACKRSTSSLPAIPARATGAAQNSTR